VEKPVRREQVEIAPVRFQGILKHALSQADLGQGEGLDFAWDFLLACWLISHSGRDRGRDLRGTSQNPIGQ
jgi:hypothetical protein